MSTRGTRPRLAPRLPSPLRRMPVVRLGLLVACAILFTGCLRAQTAIRVNDDGSGTVSLLVAIDTAAVKQFCQQFGQSSCTESESGMFSANDIDRSSLPPGTTVEPYKDGTYEGTRLTAPFQNPGEIPTVLNRLSDASSSGNSLTTSSEPQPTARATATVTRPNGTPSVTSSRQPTPRATSTAAPLASTPTPGIATPGVANAFESFSLERQGGGWKFDAVVPPPNQLSSGATEPESAAFSQAILATFLKDASFTVTLKLPGKVDKSNADQVGSDGSLIWKLDIFSNQPRTLSATTAPGGSGGTGLPVVPVAGGLIVAFIAVGGLVILRRRRQAKQSANG